MTEPYRTPALPEPEPEPAWARWARRAAVLAGAAGLAAIGWSLVPWNVRAELAIASEPAPPPVAIAAVWSDGWRSIAIGGSGTVFEHIETPGEPGAWRAV